MKIFKFTNILVLVVTFTFTSCSSGGSSSTTTVDAAISDVPFQIAKVHANDAEASDGFGVSVSVSGDYILVGARSGDATEGNVTNSGAVYLLKKQADGTITQVAKLEASDPELNDKFGESVSMSGDYIVVGAYLEDTNGSDAGSAYLFKRNSDTNISQLVKFQANDAQAGTQFGNSVSIDGDYIVVGAMFEDTSDDNVSRAGSAYLFKRNSDTDVSQVAKIQASNTEVDAYFGVSVVIDGDYIAVGAYGEDTTASGAGSAYIFKRNSDTNISQIAKIQSDDAESYDNFGISVALDGDYIAVGANGEDTTASGAGSAYIFKRNSDTNVSQIAKIQASDAASSDEFGKSLSIDGDYILVGAEYKKSATNDSEAGNAYLFKRNSDATNDVTQVKKLQAHDIHADDTFGNAVSMSGNTIVVGALYEDPIVNDEGSVYVFDMVPLNKPYIYNAPASALNFDELFKNSRVVYSFEGASPTGGVITYSLSGTDTDKFVFTDNALSFAETPDYENPVDSGVANDYNITVTATNIASSAVDMNISVKVQDRYYLDIAKLHASDAASTDYFGRSVSMDGDYIVVGTRDKDVNSSVEGWDAGSAYVYKKQPDNSVIEIAKLETTDPVLFGYFGASVSISGDYILVGAFGEDAIANDAGSAYLFKRNSDSNISLLAKLQSSDIEAGDNFGYSVAIDGNYMVIGASSESSTASYAGAAYVFKRNSDTNISQIAKIQASDPAVQDYFARAVDISGDYIVIGVNQKDSYGTSSGSVYLFKRNSDSDVSQIGKFSSNDIQTGDEFGVSVAIDGDYIVVGATKEDTTATDAGSVYVFKRNSDSFNDISQIAKMQATDPEIYENFGYSVAIEGNNIAVGIPYENDLISRAGSVYVFYRNSDTTDDVTLIEKVRPYDPEPAGLFGNAISISGNNIAIGAYSTNGIVSRTGSAYIFIKDPNQPPF
ncbi:MAG: FG-GAP repeat protein [Sulfurimonas sp.]|nr:FG-GAP repeat protein [Sulfurimonas sp.]